MPAAYNVLILGASYGSLLAIKLLAAGHTAKLVCLPAEAEAFNSDGARVRMPIKGRDGLVEVHSKKLPGKLSADAPAGLANTRILLNAKFPLSARPGPPFGRDGSASASTRIAVIRR